MFDEIYIQVHQSETSRIYGRVVVGYLTPQLHFIRISLREVTFMQVVW